MLHGGPPGSGVKLSQQEYVYKLAESVRKLYPDVKDDYLFDLEVSVKIPNIVTAQILIM